MKVLNSVVKPHRVEADLDPPWAAIVNVSPSLKYLQSVLKKSETVWAQHERVM